MEENTDYGSQPEGERPEWGYIRRKTGEERKRSEKHLISGDTPERREGERREE